jgi:hypothetical protein
VPVGTYRQGPSVKLAVTAPIFRSPVDWPHREAYSGAVRGRRSRRFQDLIEREPTVACYQVAHHAFALGIEHAKQVGGVLGTSRAS